MRKGSGARPALAALLAGGLALGAFAGSASAQGEGGGQQRNKLEFTIGMVNDIRTVNPLRAIEAPEYELLALQYDLLLNFDQKDLGPSPGLAEALPEQSEDGLTWTFEIRDDATWSDGEPITARDIAFTYNFILDNKFSVFMNYFPFTDEITAPDDTTLVWKTTKPTVAPVFPPWVYILPEHVWGGFSKDEARQFENFPDPVTSGPFRLVQWEKGDFWRLEANKEYYGGTPTLDSVVFRVFNNEEAMVQALKAGEIDFAEDLSVDLFESLEGEPGIATHVGGAASFSQMSFNSCGYPEPEAEPKYCQKNPPTAHPALADRDVRLAIAMAINKQELVDRIFRGYATPGTTIVPPAFSFWHYEPTEDELIPWDIEGANRLLDEAGYLDTDGDGVREMPGGGDPLVFRFILRTEDSASSRYGKLISGWLRQIGIETEATSVTDGKLIDAWYANDYDLYVWGWAPDPDPDFILSTFTTGQCGAWADNCYSNSAYDGLYTKQQTSTSRDERREIVFELQRMIYRDLPEIVLFYSNDLQAYRSDRWTGFVEQPKGQGYILFQYGNYSYLNIRPAGAGTGAATSAGLPPAVWIGVIAGMIVVIAAVMLARRRREADEDRA